MVSTGESERAVVVVCGLIRSARGLSSLGVFNLRIPFQGCGASSAVQITCFMQSHWPLLKKTFNHAEPRKRVIVGISYDHSKAFSGAKAVKADSAQLYAA